jgi:tRNA(fMet)-specific endonuclease VapC
MEPAVLGLVLDSSALIAAERRRLTAAETIESVHATIGELPIVLSAMTVAEVGHGIYRANTPEMRDRRRRFLDDLKATVTIYPVTETTTEIMARGGALELGYSVGTSNIRDFGRIPGLNLIHL